MLTCLRHSTFAVLELVCEEDLGSRRVLYTLGIDVIHWRKFVNHGCVIGIFVFMVNFSTCQMWFCSLGMKLFGEREWYLMN